MYLKARFIDVLKQESYAGILLVAYTQTCSAQKQPGDEQSRLLASVLDVRIAGVGVHGLEGNRIIG